MRWPCPHSSTTSTPAWRCARRDPYRTQVYPDLVDQPEASSPGIAGSKRKNRTSSGFRRAFSSGSGLRSVEGCQVEDGGCVHGPAPLVQRQRFEGRGVGRAHRGDLAVGTDPLSGELPPGCTACSRCEPTSACGRGGVDLVDSRRHHCRFPGQLRTACPAIGCRPSSTATRAGTLSKPPSRQPGRGRFCCWRNEFDAGDEVQEPVSSSRVMMPPRCGGVTSPRWG